VPPIHAKQTAERYDHDEHLAAKRAALERAATRSSAAGAGKKRMR